MAYNRFAILKRDGFRCVYCGKRASEAQLHVDHVHPRCKGGSDDPLNLVTACSFCNLSKGAQTITLAPCVPIVTGTGRPANVPEWLWDDEREWPPDVYLQNLRVTAEARAFYQIHAELRNERGRGDCLTKEDHADFLSRLLSVHRTICALYGPSGTGKSPCNQSGWVADHRSDSYAGPCKVPCTDPTASQACG